MVYSILLWLVIAVSIVLALSKRFSAVPVLVLANLICFGIQLAGVYLDGIYLADLWGLHSGEFTLVTTAEFLSSMYLHAGIAHILGNMLFFYFLGSALEEKAGKLPLLTAYFVGGIVAASTHWLLNLDSNFILIGASGAISGVMGTLLIMYPKEKTPMLVGPVFMTRVPVYISVGVFFIFETAYVFLSASDSVAHDAHVAGIIFGLGFGAILSGSASGEGGKKDEERKKGTREVGELATDERSRHIVKQLEENDQEVILYAWAEELAKNASCPDCGGLLEVGKRSIRCRHCGAAFDF